jgi:hypothetical protein
VCQKQGKVFYTKPVRLGGVAVKYFAGVDGLLRWAVLQQGHRPYNVGLVVVSDLLEGGGYGVGPGHVSISLLQKLKKKKRVCNTKMQRKTNNGNAIMM